MRVPAQSVVAIVGCSNSLSESDAAVKQTVTSTLSNLGLSVVQSDYLFAPDTRPCQLAVSKARELASYYRDSTVAGIFDVSGGDQANLMLSHIDFQAVAASPKPFFGYSDVSVILNAILRKTGMPTFYYSIRSLARENAGPQIDYFVRRILDTELEQVSFPYRFIRGTSVKGKIIGGNLRCFLKLAGTAYWPDLEDRILLLESLGGDRSRTASYIEQLQQMGVFERVRGVLLGHFNQLHKETGPDGAAELFNNVVESPSVNIMVSGELGHAPAYMMCPLNVELGF